MKKQVPPLVARDVGGLATNFWWPFFEWWNSLSHNLSPGVRAQAANSFRRQYTLKVWQLLFCFGSMFAVFLHPSPSETINFTQQQYYTQV